jgi:plastocyanin
VLLDLSKKREDGTVKKILCTLGWIAFGVTLLVMLTMAGMAGNAAGQDKAPASAEVKIDNFSFAPATLTVPAGTTVTWTNHDDIPHTVVSTDNVFKSKVLDTDEKFSFTLTKPGTYPYFCSIHPKMTGNIVVQSGGEKSESAGH